MDEKPYRPPKHPIGWTKPYWARAGLFTTVLLVSFLVSVIVVRFICGILLQAAIPAPPILWRWVNLGLDLLITLWITLYFASREGYAKRGYNVKANVLGGLLFLLAQCPMVILFQGSPFATGALATSLAQLIYFGNQSSFSSTLETPPGWLLLGCMAVVDLLVLIPVMAWGDYLGARSRAKEVAKLKEECEHQEFGME